MSADEATPGGLPAIALGDARADVAFVSRLRARPGTVRLAGEGVPVLTLRVQSADQWDALRVEVAPGTPVIELKVRALAELQGAGEQADEYVLKLNGFEVLDEADTVSASGARDGSTYLLAHRRRRPVR